MKKTSGSLKKSIVVLLISISLAFYTAGTCWAEEARITDIVVTNSGEDLLVYFTVTDCFTEDMKTAIDNGVSTVFTFLIRLDEVKDLWWDKEIADLRISHEIKYDNLKNVYILKLSSEDSKEVYVKDFDKARKIISEVAGYRVTSLMNLQKGARYQIGIMAELDKIRLPFYFHYVFFFLSLWDFETDWYIVDFKY
jgi:hypothetical protein